MKKKKVLFVINSLGLGGAEKSLVSLLPLFDYSKYDVDLLLFREGGMFRDLLDKNVNVLPLPKFVQFCNMPLIKQLASFNIKFLKTRIDLFLSLRKNAKSVNKIHDSQVYWNTCKDSFEVPKIEYDLAVGWGQGLPVKYVSTKVKAKKKAVWINADYEAVGHKRTDDLENFLNVDYIVSVSKNQTENMKQIFPEYSDRCYTIYDINNSKIIEKMASEEVASQNYDGLKIITVGRYNDYKGYDMAIDACKILVDKGYNVWWFAVGEGPERTKLENQIKERTLENRFVLLGAQTNPYKYINSSDIYVQPSRFEGYCIALTEARILNKPCVTTNFDCVYNQIIQEENGLIVEMTPEAIAIGIERLINDNELRNSIIESLKQEKKGNLEEFNKFVKILLEDDYEK